MRHQRSLRDRRVSLIVLDVLRGSVFRACETVSRSVTSRSNVSQLTDYRDFGIPLLGIPTYWVQYTKVLILRCYGRFSMSHFISFILLVSYEGTERWIMFFRIDGKRASHLTKSN